MKGLNKIPGKIKYISVDLRILPITYCTGTVNITTSRKKWPWNGVDIYMFYYMDVDSLLIISIIIIIQGFGVYHKQLLMKIVVLILCV